MPTQEEILSGLQQIADQRSLIAIFWHIVFYLYLFFIILGRKITRQEMSLFVSVPLLSVSVLAWNTANPFNGTVFVLLFVLALYFGLKNQREKVQYSGIFFRLTGAVLMLFGLMYPHFTGINLSLFIQSPLGLIPCPTLSLIIGFALFFRGFGSKPLVVLYTVAGLFYGFFGVFRLGVMVDAVLVAGSLILGAAYFYFFRRTDQ
ncbi:MAG TPA: hypothetical protein PLW67_00220 [Prolixibacteraceae bacterium]|nr:hypothetical protein [Prolixibacteraceae bacterium]